MTNLQLTGQARAMITIAALTAGPGLDRVRDNAARLIATGADPANLREAIYVASLFCGFPRAVAAMVAIADLAPQRRHQQSPPAGPEVARETGEAVFRAIHQHNADRQWNMLANAHPDFADTVLREAYGSVIARPFLSLVERELIGVACLTVEGLDRQLRAHLLGAHNCGASWPLLREVVALAAESGQVDPGSAVKNLDELAGRY